MAPAFSRSPALGPRAVTKAARRRHTLGTGADVAWIHDAARSRPPVALCLVRPSRPVALRELRLGTAQDRTARLRPLRLSRGMARAALRRVQGAPAVVRSCPGRARVRRAVTAARLRLEGTRPTRPRRPARRDRRRGRRAPGRRRPDVRPRRSRAPARTRTRPGAAARRRARPAVGDSSREVARPAGELVASTGGAPTRATAGERPRRLRGRDACTASRCSGRRRVYDRRYRIRLLSRPPWCRSTAR